MTKGRLERRLAVIMATDIVCSSRLMEADERRTLDAIKRLQASIFSPNIDTRGGRIAKLMEDGGLVAFNSAVNAVECAISLQEELARDQEELPSGERIVLRIGINLADVVIEGDHLLGDGVYVAARLEASAEPGGICIADVVHRQLGGKCRTALLDAGEISLKNVVRPVHVWHSRYAPIAAPSMSSASARTLIAVLPFENLCSSPDQTFFSDGITEDIIGGLQFSFRGSGRLTLADSKQVVPLRPKRRPLRPPVVRPVSRRLAPGSRRPA